MKKQTLILSLAFLLSSFAMQAQDFGAGVILGSPTGISVNYLLGNGNSIDGALSFDLDDDYQDIHVHSTYLWRNPKSLKVQDIYLGWYWGMGAKARFLDSDRKIANNRDDDTFLFGPRAAIGTNYEFEKHPVEVFIEASLTLHIIEDTDTDIDAGLGLRYYF
tara:strand:- start:48997 stop:49482 length:486 start_codon:yes stop_codon:yes gene_type:complete